MSSKKIASKSIKEWKKRSEIDYIPLFISLWLSFNAWMNNTHINSIKSQKKAEAKDKNKTKNKDEAKTEVKVTDRDLIEFCKNDKYKDLGKLFLNLLERTDAEGENFKANYAELRKALNNAKIQFDLDEEDKRIISFKECIINWNNREPEFDSIIRKKGQRHTIKIEEDVWVTNEPEVLFATYIEIVYQIRCLLFHGKLLPNSANERVIKQLYLTLSTIMERI